MRIAIIEDDEITRLELAKLLNTQGYETLLLTDFEKLTEELRKYSVDLVLLDINLPYDNGYEVCKKIKQVMSVPIIFVTSRDTNVDELKSIQRMVDAVKRDGEVSLRYMKSFEHDQLMYERGIEQGRLAEIKNTERERQNTEKEKLRADMAQSRIKELEAELRKYKEKSRA